MQRYFVRAEQFTGSTVVITGEDAHHAVRVMRMRTGDRFICSNGADREALVEIVSADPHAVTARVIEERSMTAEPGVNVWIAQSLPKSDKMEFVIQKCTEIGAVRFIPFISERTVVQYDVKKEEKRLERWRKIAKEAAEQAQRNRVPEIRSLSSWEQMLELAKQADLALICHEKEETMNLRGVLARFLTGKKQARAPMVLLAIGPEGGFTEREAAEAETAGFVPVRLGRTVLRTETAAMVALTCILYESGEMGD